MPSVAFAVNDGGEVLLAEDGVVTLTGTGWVDVREVHLAGDPTALPVTWTGLNTWRLEMPVSAGITELVLEAVDFHGNLVGSDTVTVYSDTSGQLLRDFLRVTEFDYNPAEPSAAELALGFTDNNDFEFIELSNTGPVPLDLDGAAVTDGVDYTFDGQGSPVTLAPGASLVVVRNLAAFEARYGTGVFVAGQYDGKLANDGESIVLRDAFGSIVEEFAYADDPPWPVEADGDGASLHRRAVDVSAGDPDKLEGRAAHAGLARRRVERRRPLRVLQRLAFRRRRSGGRGVGRRRHRHGQIALVARRHGDVCQLHQLQPRHQRHHDRRRRFALGHHAASRRLCVPRGQQRRSGHVDRRAGAEERVRSPGRGRRRLRPGYDSLGRPRHREPMAAGANPRRETRLGRGRRVLLGQRPGESGDDAAHALVNVTDVLAVHSHLHGPLAPAELTTRTISTATGWSTRRTPCSPGTI